MGKRFRVDFCCILVYLLFSSISLTHGVAGPPSLLNGCRGVWSRHLLGALCESSQLEPAEFLASIWSSFLRFQVKEEVKKGPGT